MIDFEIIVCKECGDDVEQVSSLNGKTIYYCHSCDITLDENGVDKEDPLSDGFVRRDGNEVEVKGLFNIMALFRGF